VRRTPERAELRERFLVETEAFWKEDARTEVAVIAMGDRKDGAVLLDGEAVTSEGFEDPLERIGHGFAAEVRDERRTA
jgi:hypothetical protein